MSDVVDFVQDPVGAVSDINWNPADSPVWGGGQGLDETIGAIQQAPQIQAGQPPSRRTQIAEDVWKRETDPNYRSKFVGGVGATSDPVGGYGSFGGTAPIGRSALALEQRLRSEARKKMTPNVEYTFNLEQNPIANPTATPPKRGY